MALLARLRCLPLLRPARQLYFSVDRMKNKSSFDLNKEVQNIRAGEILSSEACQEILSRTRVVTETEDCRAVVGSLMSAGTPVGLDMEGVTNTRTSMVQISDVAGNITLFRTGVNPDLLSKGGLADLLQSPNILKVIHAATVDCLSIYKDGVKMWNIYDTSVAYKVLDFQMSGSDLYSSSTISFNNLCSYYGLQENPFKDIFKNILWKMNLTKDGAFGLDNPEPMLDELIVYSAWDVEPLISLYEILQRGISPCYHHLVSQMSEIEVLRAIDPGLAKAKRKNLKNLSLLSLFLSNLPPDTSPADLYISLTGQTSGYKHVYFSMESRTANVLLESREMAVTAFKEYNNWATEDMKSHATNCRLVVENFDNETFTETGGEPTEAGSESDAVFSGQSKTSASIEPDQCRDIVRALLSSKSPVVVDFSLHSAEGEGEESVGVELYLGTMPSYKLILSRQILVDGDLASLFSGEPVKVINRMDSLAVSSAVSFLFKNNVNVRNVFDLSMAARSVDFFKYGQSWFQQGMPSTKNIGKYIGLTIDPRTSKQHQSYLAYLELRRTIPPKIHSLLETFAEYEMISAARTPESLKAKAKRSDLKRDLENKCVHVRLVGRVRTESRDKLRSLVFSFTEGRAALTDDEQKTGTIRDYSEFGRSVLVLMANSHGATQLVEYLENQSEHTDIKYVVTNTKFLKKTLEKPKSTIDMKTLDLALRENLTRLSDAGLQISYPEDCDIPF